MPKINENSCRICLAQCTGKDQTSSRFSNAYKMFTVGFEIKPDDVPKKICADCIQELKRGLDFRNKCVRTENKLFAFMFETPCMDSVEEEEEETPVEQPEEEIPVEDNVDAETTEYEVLDISVKTEPEIHILDTEEVAAVVAIKKEKKARKTVDKKDPSYCDQCGQEFKDKAAFRKHVAEHSRSTEAQDLTCDICMKNGVAKSTFSAKRLLTQHIRRTHLNIKKAKQCPHCDRIFYSINTYQCHVYRQHTDPKDYKYECLVCQKRFFQAHLLKIHQLTHSNEKNHTCFVCGAKFTMPQHLKTHMTNIHNPQSISCVECGKNFGNEKYLKQHMKIHNKGEYECPLCPNSCFNHSTTLRTHLKKEHPEFPLPSPGTVLKNFDWSQFVGSESTVVFSHNIKIEETIDCEYLE